MMKKYCMSIGFVGLMATSHAGWDAPREAGVSSVSDQHSVVVTIYNDNLALAKDARRIMLSEPHTHTRIASGTDEGQTTLTYRGRVRY